MAEWYSIVHIHCIFFVHSSTDAHLGWFHLLTSVNNAAMSIGVHTSFWISFIFFRWIPRSGRARSYSNSILNFLRNSYTVFHSGRTSLQSHQRCLRLSFSPQPVQYLLFLVILIISIQTDIRWYPIVILVFISLIINDVTLLSLCLLANSMCSLEKCLCRASADFWIVLFVFMLFSCCWVVWVLKYILSINPSWDVGFASTFSHALGFLFVLLMAPFAVQSFLVQCGPICLFFPLFPLPLESHPKQTSFKSMSRSLPPVFSSRNFMVSGLTFKPLIHFEFIFMCGIGE